MEGQTKKNESMIRGSPKTQFPILFYLPGGNPIKAFASQISIYFKLGHLSFIYRFLALLVAYRGPFVRISSRLLRDLFETASEISEEAPKDSRSRPKQIPKRGGGDRQKSGKEE
ncbi:hypothetical protein SY85_21005 [Flavisolibacter tropicus]|uniref:Uncharacterized protein n=1 Tax=Flavisolibacter tropicus TaxID=1492898 RepID=A0A172TZU8_9BACT|nr:hypothetical protein SY85_21005 [Flavisolibacter tropicus]